VPGFGASEVLVRGQSRRGAAFAVAIAVPAFAVLVCEVTNNELFEEFVALLVAAEAIAFFMLPAVAPEGISFITGERRGSIRADREGITFRGRSLLLRGQIRNIAIEALAGGIHIIHISALRERDGLHLELEDDEKARALVAALELEPDKHVASFSVDEDPLRTRARRFAARAFIAAVGIGLAGGVLTLARTHELLLLALVPVLLVYALLLPRARVRTEIMLGADGLTLHHHGRPRSIGLASISDVRSSPCEALLVLGSGEELVLRFGVEDDAAAVIQHGAFVARIRLALARTNRPHDPGEALLARGERGSGEWASDLLSLARTSEGYRIAPVPEETLWRIAESASAEPSARVGALVALRSRLDDQGRSRLHVLAARTAQSDLRAALEAAADGAEADQIIAAYERSRA
jgi:hypothetical protein